MALSNFSTNSYSVPRRNQSQKMWSDRAYCNMYSPAYSAHIIEQSFAKKPAGSLYLETALPCIGTDGQIEIAHSAGRKDYTRVGLPFDGGFHQ